MMVFHRDSEADGSAPKTNGGLINNGVLSESDGSVLDKDGASTVPWPEICGISLESLVAYGIRRFINLAMND